MEKLIKNKLWLRTLFIVLGFFVVVLLPQKSFASTLLNDLKSINPNADDASVQARDLIANAYGSKNIKVIPKNWSSPPSSDNPPQLVLETSSGNVVFTLASWHKNANPLWIFSGGKSWYFKVDGAPNLYIDITTELHWLNYAWYGMAWGNPGSIDSDVIFCHFLAGHCTSSWSSGLPGTYNITVEGMNTFQIESYLRDNHDELISFLGDEGGYLQNLLESTASGLMEDILNAVNYALESIIHGLIRFLDKFLIVNLNQDGIIQGWAAVRNAANVMLVVALLFIAVFNAMRFQIEYYTAKALIPRLAMAAIGINFSFLMTKAIVDTGNIMSNYFLSQTSFDAILGTSQASAWLAASGLVAIGIAFYLMWAVILLAVLVAVGTVFLVLLFRIAVLYILAMFSPLVFLFMVLPFTRGLTGQWWNYLIKFTFMGAVMSLILFAASNI